MIELSYGTTLASLEFLSRSPKEALLFGAVWILFGTAALLNRRRRRLTELLDDPASDQQATR